VSESIIAIVVQTLILAVSYLAYDKKKRSAENDKEVAHAERHARTDADVALIKQEQSAHKNIIANIDKKQNLMLNLIKRLIRKDSKNG